MYSNMPEDFYAKEIYAGGVKSLWNWHKKRTAIVAEMVKRAFSGGLVLDIGCGNSLWNIYNIPTVGIDICEPMLKYNKEKTAEFYPLKADISKNLPVKDKSIDIVVITEVLEHIRSYIFLLKEVKRVLKPAGIIICSVPYAKFPGLWNLLFVPWCLIKGMVTRDSYYLHLCGHVVNFNIKKVKKKLKDFELLEIKTMGLFTIFFIARKK
jgi:ubiquinone/menaquinone biosynthesis C-methylase UbiE